MLELYYEDDMQYQVKSDLLTWELFLFLLFLFYLSDSGKFVLEVRQNHLCYFNFMLCMNNH